LYQRDIEKEESDYMTKIMPPLVNYRNWELDEILEDLEFEESEESIEDECSCYCKKCRDAGARDVINAISRFGLAAMPDLIELYEVKVCTKRK
jgi:hypothetical protein